MPNLTFLRRIVLVVYCVTVTDFLNYFSSASKLSSATQHAMPPEYLKYDPESKDRKK